jgi:hypothetical protein
VAINQLGIATNLINTLFTGFVGALAVTLGLAFGLGRDLASRTLENGTTRLRKPNLPGKRGQTSSGSTQKRPSGNSGAVRFQQLVRAG